MYISFSNSILYFQHQSSALPTYLGLVFALKTYLLMRHADKIYNVRLRLRIIVTNVWSGFIWLDWEEAC